MHYRLDLVPKLDQQPRGLLRLSRLPRKADSLRTLPREPRNSQSRRRSQCHPLQHVEHLRLLECQLCSFHHSTEYE